jgi:hypothetical protein
MTEETEGVKIFPNLSDIFSEMFPYVFLATKANSADSAGLNLTHLIKKPDQHILEPIIL